MLDKLVFERRDTGEPHFNVIPDRQYILAGYLAILPSDLRRYMNATIWWSQNISSHVFIDKFVRRGDDHRVKWRRGSTDGRGELQVLGRTKQEDG